MQFRLRTSSSVPSFSSPLHPVLQRILAARGVSTEEQIQLNLAGLLPPDSLRGLEQAVDLLLRARKGQKRILIVADYDADGATSCALAMIGLRQLGWSNLCYIVPNRFDYGYGLTPPIVELARQRNPDVLITVDNGIASNAGVALARQYGIDVLITDHHLAGAELPAATAILNPNQPHCAFASKALAGVGVVFYLLLGLRKALRARGEFGATPEPNLANLLDLVALGTVADVVPLDDNNRRLVKHGLALIRQGRCRPGIAALLEAGGRNPAQCVASDLGFAAGPRLNAAGRLDDMSLGIECLLSEDPSRAQELAAQLDTLNRERKLIEQGMQDSALQQLDSLDLASGDHRSLCLYDAAWHQGVIGILASRIKDRLHCPVIVFADAGLDEQGERQVKGSARSLPGIHMRDLLDAVATLHPGLLEKFGGHAMAAGLTLRLKHFADFASAFDGMVRNTVAPELLQREHWHDGSLPVECLTLAFAEQLRTLMPWGQHFPEPLFYDEFEILSWRVLAERHLKFSLRGEQGVLEAIAFHQGHRPPQLQRRVRLLYKLDVNEYRGERVLQLLIEHLEYFSG